jgi:cephalosporin hydroxylase
VNLHETAREFLVESARGRYSYNFSWFGSKVIQYPQDLMALQEIIVRTKPRTIIETGGAYGGLTKFLGSILELQTGSSCQTITVEKGPLPELIDVINSRENAHLVTGNSVDPLVVARVRSLILYAKRVMVILDSDHHHQHVLQELEAYAPLVTAGCYIVVCDTSIELLPKGTLSWKDWQPGDNPATAVTEFLSTRPEYVVDRSIDEQLLVSACIGGYIYKEGPSNVS